MTRIQPESTLCTVIVTVDAEEPDLADLEAHARDGLARFAAFPGFLSGALHRSSDGKRLVQYLQWQTEADHLACMNHPDWDRLPSAQRFLEAVRSGRARLNVNTYRVLSVVEAGGPDPA